MKKAIIPCICMTCGIRNDFQDQDGLCQNRHDNWLEYRDVLQQNEFFESFRQRLGLSSADLTRQFLDTSIFQLSLPARQGWFKNSRNPRAHYYDNSTLALCGKYAQGGEPPLLATADAQHLSKCVGCLTKLASFSTH